MTGEPSTHEPVSPVGVEPVTSENGAGSARILPGTDSTIPKAVVIPSRPRRPVSKLWWLTALSGVVAVVLVATSIIRQGSEIKIRFADGHGLKAGDVVRYRGISVGEVTDVEMGQDLKGIVCTIVLDPQSASLARRGSEFWIERPQISLSRVSGLETVVGAKFVGVRPGPAGSPRVYDFVGIETPPVLSESDFTEITIRFADGYGLQPGDPVRHRGIVIGEVTSVDLNDDLASVLVRVRLHGMGGKVARTGSQFWIEKPQVSITEVRGLDTIVGGRYVAVIPAAPDAEASSEFTGLDTAPVAEIPAGALEVLLHAPQRWGIDRGVPVTYRGLRVGQIHSVGLSSDGTRIEARASIEAKYRPLVRRNTVFWSTSGIDVGFGFTGLQMTTETLTTIAQGGIAFATPDPPGEPVNSGQRFAFERRPPDIAEWNPHIDVMQTSHAEIGQPQPLRAVVRWSEKSFGFRRNYERSGWVTLLGDKRIVAPLDLLIPSQYPLDDVVMELAGAQITLDPKQVHSTGLIGSFAVPGTLPEGVPSWPVQNIRHASDPENVLIVADAQTAAHPMAASSLKVRNELWEPATSNGLTSAWHGAPVVASLDGKLVGLLVISKSKPVIVPLRPMRSS